ncbi:threonine/homoserine/homoserine lactone efflux protein [Mesocricetibacter intestinalis]|uniref:Threonine/homoserine/homoserine lactone efflux protein n=1 Tax=Mesocricetibacter intestinalis TaxID=1521930 RepID=A0A4R6V8E3_9PAST|nr:LysE family translocator [Mesocricetibacter intestinalis]TDQ57624.1 threonine/homoserine/homoserine lactone efflux protein [Mesocricetibacter intestinalis]
MAHEYLLSFWILSLSLAISPGQDWAYLISASIKRATLPALGGILVGYLAITLLLASGLGVSVAAHPGILTAMTYAGAGYLIWLGIQSLRHPATIDLNKALNVSSRRKWFYKGTLVSGLNVKGLLLLMAVLPQFTSPSFSWSLPMQILVLGLIFIANCALFYSFFGFGTGALLASRPAYAKGVSRFSGIAMLVVAGALLLSTF